MTTRRGGGWQGFCSAPAGVVGTGCVVEVAAGGEGLGRLAGRGGGRLLGKSGGRRLRIATGVGGRGGS